MTAQPDNVEQLHPETDTEQPDRESILRQPDAEFLAMIEQAIVDIEGMEDERAEVNERIAAVKAQLVKHGINKHALKTVMAYRKLDDDKRENYDLTQQLLRRAIKTPVQMELLDAQIERTH